MPVTYNTEKEWTAANKGAFEWYYSTYPFLKKFRLPISHSKLSDFYQTDMYDRNLKPNPVFIQTYEFLFSYFLENYPRLEDKTRFEGKTGLGYFIGAVPSGIGKTFKPVSNIFEGITNISQFFKDFYLIFVFLILYYLWRQIK